MSKFILRLRDRSQTSMPQEEEKEVMAGHVANVDLWHMEGTGSLLLPVELLKCYSGCWGLVLGNK